MVEISCVIPATRINLLDRVIESIYRQTRPIKEVIVVLDGQDLEWQPSRSGLTVIKNLTTMGKVKSTLNAVARARAELILSVDCDTILSPDSCRKMELSLTDDIEVVCARIEPLDQSTWIGRTRADLYRKWHARPGLINGACFLARKKTFEANYPKLKTMVEDQELTRILSSPARRWTICQEAVVMTEEPRTIRSLFHQLVRWAYGSQDLRRMSEEHYKAKLAFLFSLAFLGGLSAVSAAIQLNVVVFALSLAWPILLISAATTRNVTNYYAPGISLRRVVPYSIIEAVAFVVGGTRFVIGRPPKW